MHAARCLRTFGQRPTTILPSTKRQATIFTTQPSIALPTPLDRWQSIFRNAYRQQQRTFRQQTNSQQRYNYKQFQTTKSRFRRWSQRPTFYIEVAGLGVVVGTFVVYNSEEVPVSRRRRLNVVSQETERELGKQMYVQTMREYQGHLLPSFHPKHRQVQRVLERLIPHSGLRDEQWEVHVIENPEKNAFVVPGGKVFFFSGMVDFCRSDDAVAAVLGHEIAHNVAHHAAEQMTRGWFLALGVFIFSFLTGADPSLGRIAADFAINRPKSRNQESEADYIGLLIMAESCYDPEAAADLWRRMEEQEKGSIPEFISTHPSNYNRLGKIREWMSEAEAKREEGDCVALGSYVGDFRNVYDSFRR